MRLPRARCPDCGKVCAVRPPMGGDGSCDVFPRHQTTTAGYSRIFCEGSRQEVRPADYLEDAHGD